MDIITDETVENRFKEVLEVSLTTVMELSSQRKKTLFQIISHKFYSKQQKSYFFSPKMDKASQWSINSMTKLQIFSKLLFSSSEVYYTQTHISEYSPQPSNNLYFKPL